MRSHSIQLIFVLMATSLPSPARAGDREQAKRSFQEGNQVFDQGRFAEAAAAYGRAIREDANFAEAFYNRALAEELVNRQNALQDWQRFLELARDAPDLKWDAAQVKARIQILQDMPPLPEAMQPARYAPQTGDYYRLIAAGSEGEQWRELPVKVFLGNAPQMKWQEGTRAAYDIWSAVFPVQLAALLERADIRVGWEESVEGVGRAGEEMDWVQVKTLGGVLSGRKIAVITTDLSHDWSKDEMRAIMLHEMGHALGIKGHSDSAKDIMYWRMQERRYQVPVPNTPLSLFWKSLVKQPSQRDLNTLIRLYNSAGPIQRFQ